MNPGTHQAADSARATPPRATPPACAMNPGIHQVGSAARLRSCARWIRGFIGQGHARARWIRGFHRPEPCCGAMDPGFHQPRGHFPARWNRGFIREIRYEFGDPSRTSWLGRDGYPNSSRTNETGFVTKVADGETGADVADGTYPGMVLARRLAARGAAWSGCCVVARGRGGYLIAGRAWAAAANTSATWAVSR